MMNPPVQVERRVGQRFPYLLPVTIHEPSGEIQTVGITQDLSARGVFFLIDTPLKEGSEIELTLRMPSEITLGAGMPVRCKGRVLRVVRTGATSATGTSSKIGVAVRFECYEYLPERPDSAAPRISALHSHREDEPLPLEVAPSRMIL
jgi:PilZ domain